MRSEVISQSLSKSTSPDNNIYVSIHFQVRSPTGVHGKAVNGALHEATSLPDTSGSTLEQSHSNAATATGECVRTGSREVDHVIIGRDNTASYSRECTFPLAWR